MLEVCACASVSSARLRPWGSHVFPAPRPVHRLSVPFVAPLPGTFTLVGALVHLWWLNGVPKGWICGLPSCPLLVLLRSILWARTSGSCTR